MLSLLRFLTDTSLSDSDSLPVIKERKQNLFVNNVETRQRHVLLKGHVKCISIIIWLFNSMMMKHSTAVSLQSTHEKGQQVRRYILTSIDEMRNG